MLIDRYLPTFDATSICEASIAAPPEAVYATIRATNLRDPVIDFLFAIRELPLRIVRRPVTAEEFLAFAEPGYAKLAIGLAVRPAGTGVIVRYEARTATTDESARRKFRVYWRMIAMGVALVMRRALNRIKAQAEQHAAVAA